ncbi:DNA polymerase I [Acidocella sp.]|uniref:DNA polymerase I n=1 Tax=Acidocella sp. TaxID=50710 RepID=UPI002607E97D|nr:DNA polymerase I [Acidocella sp.]
MKLVLVDGSGFIFRAFHALPDMQRPDGVHVNAVFGFCNMLARLLKEHTGTHLAVIFDAGRKTFRNRLYNHYKAHRPEPPPELVPQFALIREATKAFGVPSIELADWEADDLIASYAKAARAAGGEVVIVSSDKDLMQLIRDGVTMLDPIKATPIGSAEVEAKFGVPPEKVVEVQALIGDSVDNVPGVPGIGPKGAAALINEFGTLDGVLAAAAAMKPSKRRDALIEHADAARLSRQLVILRDDAPLPLPLEDLAVKPWDAAVLRAFLTENGFRSIRHRLGLEDGQAEESAPVEPSHAPFGPYPLIVSLAELRAIAAAARETGVLALSVQTDDPAGLHGRLVGLGLAARAGQAAYLPLGHEAALDAPPALDWEAAAAELDPLLADVSVMKVFHDAKYSAEALARAGLAPPAPLDDVMLISYAQDAGNFAHDLATLARVHLSHTVKTANEVTGTGRGRLSFAAAPLDKAAGLAGEAADVTLRLWETLKPALRVHKSFALYELVEKRLIPVLAGMEAAGVLVDKADLTAMSAEFASRMAALEEEIRCLAGRDFNVGSPKQLGEVLFEEMKLPGGKRGKNGAWGTDSAVLESLAEQGAEIAARVLDWRQLAKLKTTYADALIQQVDPVTGRVHTSFQMAATTTGRLSSTDPNLQNIPVRTEEGGRIRRAFIAPAGARLISADYSQIELRLLAHVANIPALKESFAKAEDIHTRTASEVFGIPMAGMDSATRRRAKAINFGIIYGISAFGLARQLGITPGEARDYIEAYFRRYPEIRAYMETTKEQARTQGYVLTPFGRRCWVPRIRDKIPATRAYAERQAINAPLQGGAADIIKRAMVKLPKALRAAGLSTRLLLQVHDELLFEAPEAEAEAAAALAREVMQNAASLSVPLVVETGTGKNWAEAH